jgi:3-hydroxyacyl-[acyl-carrier-protein] dehydratase
MIGEKIKHTANNQGLSGYSRDVDGSGMDETWHSLSHKKDTSSHTVLAEACAKTGSLWFSGHFPNDPILPGIAILSMVTDVVKHHESEMGRESRISGIRRVRFRLPVRPDETLTISLSLPSQEDGFSYHFNVSVNGKTACTGVVSAEPFLEES